MTKTATGRASGTRRRTVTRNPRVVADLMSRDVVTVADDASVRDLARLLWTNGISGVPVQAKDGRLVGMVSSHDILWLAERMERKTDFCRWSGLDTYTVRDIMTPDLFTVTSSTSIDHLRVATVGTPFQQRVWAALRTIPCGETMSYGDLARRIGQPSAVRAVGLANGANPIPIVVPCHRVIGASGQLVGYGGGLHRKQWLLAHERARPAIIR